MEDAENVAFQHILSYSNASDHLHLLGQAAARTNDGALEIRVHVESREQNQNGPILKGKT